MRAVRPRCRPSSRTGCRIGALERSLCVKRRRLQPRGGARVAGPEGSAHSWRRPIDSTPGTEGIRRVITHWLGLRTRRGARPGCQAHVQVRLGRRASHHRPYATPSTPGVPVSGSVSPPAEMKGAGRPGRDGRLPRPLERGQGLRVRILVRCVERRVATEVGPARVDLEVQAHGDRGVIADELALQDVAGHQT